MSFAAVSLTGLCAFDSCFTPPPPLVLALPPSPVFFALVPAAGAEALVFAAVASSFSHTVSGSFFSSTKTRFLVATSYLQPEGTMEWARSRKNSCCPPEEVEKEARIEEGVKSAFTVE